MPHPNQYTVGWICAIRTEFVAAQTLLDEEHEALDHVSQHDNNSYALGSIGKHNVAIAVLPIGEYGTASAASVARDMLHTFPNIRIGLMVGVGGGAPSPKNDVRLGDVVVSVPGGGEGGVFQYDFGKTVQDQKFQNTGFLNQPPTFLRTATNALSTKYDLRGTQLDSVIRDTLESFPNLKEKYRRPDANADNLYRSDIIHGDEGCCAASASVDSSKLVRRPRRTKNPNGPAVHYGLIASANTLMKNALVRDQLSREKNVLCFEMEAAGLMNHFPCLVIRGICDYSDTHKNKDWQGYAAMAAAAYAKELLYIIAPSQIEAERKIVDVLDESQYGPKSWLRLLWRQSLTFEVVKKVLNTVQVSVGVTNTEIKDIKEDTHATKLKTWLSPPDPSTNLNKALEQRHRGSGQWLLDSMQYMSWKEKPDRLLWLHGIPGCGKTILSATVVEDLRQSSRCSQTLLYFYFDFSEATKQTFEHVFRSLVIQLYLKSRLARKHLDSLYHTACQNGKEQPSIELLREAFSNMAREADEVWIIFDALDECQMRNDRRQILSWIEELWGSQTKIHLLVTSRPEQDIESTMNKMAPRPDIIPIQRALIEHDICSYIRMRVHEGPGLNRWKSRPNVQTEIEDNLIRKANGMFRWATCQFDELEVCLDYPSVKRVLRSLPKTLDDTYARILAKIPEQHEHYTKRILQFLVFSESPLSINEAVDAIAVDTEKAQFDPEDRMPNPKEISQCCSSLVVIVPGKNDKETIQLAHFSVKEYLASDRVKKDIATYVKEDAARTSIAKVCLTYLLRLDHSLRVEQIKEQFPLAFYSAKNWMSHAVVAETNSEEVRTLAMRFFSHSAAYQACVQLFNPDIVWYKCNHPESPSALYYAIFGGLFYIVQILLDRIPDINSQVGPYQWTVLYLASRQGHEEIVRMLLKEGADINFKNGSEMTALYIASSRGHEKIVQVLLNNGADVNARAKENRTALYTASSRGHEKIVRMLLDEGADFNVKIKGTQTALDVATRRGHNGIVQLLLEKLSKGAAVAGAHYASFNASFSSRDSEDDWEQKGPYKSGAGSGVKFEVEREPGLTSGKPQRSSSQETMFLPTPPSSAQTIPHVDDATMSIIEQAERPAGQSTPDASSLARLTSPTSGKGGTRRKKSGNAHRAHELQTSSKPGKSRAPRKTAAKLTKPFSEGIATVTALVPPLFSAAPSGKKRRKADETSLYGPQAGALNLEPGKPGVKRRRVYLEDRGLRVHHI